MSAWKSGRGVGFRFLGNLVRVGNSRGSEQHPKVYKNKNFGERRAGNPQEKLKQKF